MGLDWSRVDRLLRSRPAAEGSSMRLDLATQVNGGRATRGGRARTARLLAIGFGALCGALFATSAAANAGVGRDFTCSGGNIPAGSYESITVTGVCYMPAGTITVE